METTQDVTEADAEKEPKEGEQGAATPGPEGSREDGFTVSLDEVFQGPLDLLLHLVKEQEVEIQDVRLADVANAYMDHVRALRDLDIEVAGEFLLIAATPQRIGAQHCLFFLSWVSSYTAFASS